MKDSTRKLILSLRSLSNRQGELKGSHVRNTQARSVRRLRRLGQAEWWRAQHIGN